MSGGSHATCDRYIPRVDGFVIAHRIAGPSQSTMTPELLNKYCEGGHNNDIEVKDPMPKMAAKKEPRAKKEPKPKGKEGQAIQEAKTQKEPKAKALAQRNPAAQLDDDKGEIEEDGVRIS